MSFVKEFKEFAMKGNVVDMAVGVVIGAAFGKIVSSLVADVITPPLGLLVGGVDFSGLAWTIKEGAGSAGAVTINYGKFVQAAFDFLIVATAMFCVIKFINAIKRAEAKSPAAPVPPSNQELLLAEIRDLLKQKAAK